MSKYSEVCEQLQEKPTRWLITGVAGFIGSNLLQALLMLNQEVTGLDNFLTGHQKNLDMVRELVGENRWRKFHFIEGDIRNEAACHAACSNVQHVLHEAALGSVPRSIENPLLTNGCNITGFLNMLVAAKNAGVESFVYAASSSTYGDSTELPKHEDRTGAPLSPYAVTKLVDELYAQVFARCYGFSSIGLRYFNVFGQRQDPEGAYAAVIPRWAGALLRNEPIYINGDGETSRDFCYIENVVQANILASLADGQAKNLVYNVAYGERISLKQLFALIQQEIAQYVPEAASVEAIYRDFRPGDVRHSLADISRAKTLLGYMPKYNVRDGLKIACEWYARNL